MYIQEIIVDGFKSYAQRTVIDGFDPHFNAITGLNGSGKSNILDSICFVLGITNLSQVRAGNLSELVYKQGQAGVNKATVTIVFNNSDPSGSPVGYEQVDQVTVTRQVLIGGKSKYLINGKNAPAGQVQNLFHSVQLNVNNPHFLIMQGRITKVLNMKPNEILGMVEEAAGTRMYETKRVAALKTMEKKQIKLDELQTILDEEITPTLERLRGEKQAYLTWSKNNADLERLERFVTAAEYMRAVAACESDGMAELEGQLEELEARARDIKAEMEQIDREISDQSDMLQGEFAETLRAAKELEKERSKDLVKASSAWKSRQESARKAESDLEAARKLVLDSKSAIEARNDEMKDESAAMKELLAAAEQAQQTLSRLTEDYQNMSAGISMSQGDEGRTPPDQITKALSDSKTAQAKVGQAKLRISHLTKELKLVEKEMKKVGDSSTKLTRARDKASAKVAQLKSQLESLEFSEDEYALLDREKQELEASIAELNELIETLNTKLAAKLKFKYQDPVRGFDRTKVKGLVSKLIAVRDSKNSTALEVVAGGKLYQVVVDEAITGKALLDRGKLERRVTLIPLDKIKSRPLGRETCREADRIAGELGANAAPAIDLVQFDEEVRSAIEYVFGSSIVVDSAEAANRVCEATKTRTVTLEGDTYDPSGTISGGSRDAIGSTLTNLYDLKRATQDLNEKQARFRVLQEKLSSMEATNAKFEKINRELSVADAELSNAVKHLSQTSFGVLVEKRDTMAKDLEAAESERDEMEKESTEKRELYEALKGRESQLTQERENKLQELEQSLQRAKLDATEKNKRANEAESRLQNFELEMGCLSNDLNAAVEAEVVAANALREETMQEEEIRVKVEDLQALYEEAKQDLDRMNDLMANRSTELAGLKSRKSSLAKEEDVNRLESKKLSLALLNLKKERSASENLVTALLKRHPWIETEKAAFGMRGGDYDFEANNASKAQKRLKDLRADQEALTKQINKKVMGMIEKAEAEYTELLRKRKVVENDKKKIQAVIEELDVKKKSELNRTWRKVNKDFGSIFTTLLPGASAKLEPPEGMQAWEGLEVRVAFGTVWKESLSELSGGQRSLLALSLILSLLLFKPAPMYILDEVDAALDLSHTQNIGNMLKTHFSQSQFIVVSLKEGMFNNANVIYRTKFVDGVSTVTRTIGTGSSRHRALAASNAEDSSVPNMGKATKATSRRRGKENSSD